MLTKKLTICKKSKPQLSRIQSFPKRTASLKWISKYTTMARQKWLYIPCLRRQIVSPSVCHSLLEILTSSAWRMSAVVPVMKKKVKCIKNCFPVNLLKKAKFARISSTKPTVAVLQSLQYDWIFVPSKKWQKWTSSTCPDINHRPMVTQCPHTYIVHFLYIGLICICQYQNKEARINPASRRVGSIGGEV